jgi:hypothetical protein
VLLRSLVVQSFVQIAAVTVAFFAPAQAPIRPIQLEPPSGGGNPVVVTVTGVEQDPAPVAARWNGDDSCLADIACFVGSWIEANSADSPEHLVALRVPDERADLQKRLADPQLLARNAARFKQIRSWSLLGWIDYGGFRVVMLAKDDPASSTSPVYTLPIKRTGARWAQTDGLATDSNIYPILDRLATAVLDRHRQSRR